MATSAEALSILVVDDDRDIRDALRELLVNEGFDVVVARDGLDALLTFDSGREVDALVCDLDMPRLDGTSLVRLLRRRGFHLVVIVLSGRFDMLATSADLGQIYALAKPFEADQLLRVLREALEERA